MIARGNSENMKDYLKENKRKQRNVKREMIYEWKEVDIWEAENVDKKG